ncbi:MAG: DoxX [Parcubacteria group bacterium GW2011_GWD2_38_11]|nr:MAG: DoxX [Parcubacteria group bacterium GW2011_GWD2_38_11]
MNIENEKRNNNFRDATLLILRLVVAAIFLFAAYAKLSFWSVAPAGIPEAMVNLTKFLSVVEPLGAAALIVGFLTRWAASGLAIIMIGAIVILRLTMQTNFFTAQTGTGLDYNFLILGSCIALIAFGAGRWSIDRWRNIR